MSASLPPLSAAIEPTRSTLHAYALAVAAVPRAHAVPDPRWWHISLKLSRDGLSTDPVPLPDGRWLAIRMDLRVHGVVVEVGDQRDSAIDMTAGLTGTEMADRVIEIASGCGLNGPFDRSKFQDDEAGAYVPGHASELFDAFTAAHQIFTTHRSRLEGEMSPIQVWPHGFDIAFEWYGDRMVRNEDDGTAAPAQLNLGFYPKGRAYFYSNPWPFDGDALLDVPLPSGATWHTDGWEGSILYYDQVSERADGEQLVLEYARTVFDAAAATLTAPDTGD